MSEEFLSEFFERIIGAFIFIAGLTAIILIFNQISSLTTQVKEGYADDAVYAESSFQVTDESVVSRDELIAMLMICPQKNITIKVDASAYGNEHVIEITSGIGLENTVKHEENNLLTANAEVISMGKDRWDYRKLDLQKWLHASKYQRSDITNADGEVVSVMYWGRD